MSISVPKKSILNLKISRRFHLPIKRTKTLLTKNLLKYINFIENFSILKNLSKF